MNFRTVMEELTSQVLLSALGPIVLAKAEGSSIIGPWYCEIWVFWGFCQCSTVEEVVDGVGISIKGLRRWLIPCEWADVSVIFW